jgi:hypothetical protein
MVKIVTRSLNKNSPSRSASVAKKRVRDANGNWRTVHKLDANSASFAKDFQYVFSKSVAKARKENREISEASLAKRKR